MNILFLVAHPDDEILGCGATLFKHAKLGHSIDILFLADGSSSRTEVHGGSRNSKADKIFEMCSCKGNTFFLNLPDNQLDSLPLLDVIKKVESKIAKNPTHFYDIVYTHFGNDLNIDHRYCSEIARTIFRPQPGIRTRKLLEFETPSATEWSFAEFKPQIFIDANEGWDFKLKALNIYADEMREFPHPRSIQGIEALAQYRGSTVGLNRAEAFKIVWERKEDLCS